MRKTMKRLAKGATRLLVLALGLGLASTALAATKLGEGITAYYDCETHTDSGTTVTVTGKKWDSGSLVDDQNLTFVWNCNSGAGIGTPTTTKFDLCYSGGGTGGRCWESETCAGLCPGTSAGDWSFSFWVVRNNNTVNNLFVNSSSGTKLTSWADSDITGASSSNTGFGIYLTTGNKIGVRLSETTDGSTFNVVSIISSSAYTWDQNTWHNVIVVRSGTVLKLYVDGTFAGSATMTDASYLVDPVCLTMATSSSGGIGQQNGADEFCVWNRALFPSEIASIGSGTSAISGLVNEEAYRFSNADTDSLATTSNPSYHTATLSFKLNDPSASHAVGDFPSSGYVKLSSISIAAHGDTNYRDPVTAVLTNDKTGDSYTATVSYSSGNDFPASLSSAVTDSSERTWARSEVSLSFSSSYEILMDVTATYTLTFKNSSNVNADLGYSVVNKDSTGWKPVMRIYGRPASGSMVLSSSLIPSSGGASLPSTVTVKDVTGFSFDDDSVTIGNGGIVVNTTTRPLTVMMKVEDIPDTQSVLAAVLLANNKGMTLTRTTTGFQQGEANNGALGTNNGQGWGEASTTAVSAGEHWITLTYEHTANGTHSYMDGASVACSTAANGLRYSGSAVTAVALGGPADTVANYQAAEGMSIKDVQIYSTELTAAQIATVTAALNKGWAVNAAGTMLTSTTLRELPNDANVKVAGSLSVATDGTCSLVSATTVQVLAGGSLDIGTNRPAIAGVEAGGTLVVAANVTMSERIVGYTPSATLTVTGDIDGTVTLNGGAVTPVIDSGTATLTGTAVAGDPTYTGNGWWWDYEFNGNGNNIGSEGTGMQWDDPRPFQGSEYTTADESGNQMLHLPSRPWRNVSGGYPSEFTAVMFCKAGATANGILVAFGSTTWGSTKTITLSTGDDPSAGEMRLVYGSGQNSSTDLVEGGFTLDNITSANHLYAFTVKTVGGVSQIAVYADGDLLTTYTADSIISLGTGFQIASGHGGLPNGLSRLANDDAATMDFLRVSNVALSEAAIKALAAEYRYVSPNGIAERTLSANATWTDETNTSWSQKTLNEDGSTTTTAQAAPNNGTVVEVTASTDVQVTMDLSSEVSYEKVTFQGDGAITVKAGGTAPTVTTRTYINTDVTMDIAAFASLGAITVADGKTLTLVPSDSGTLAKGIGLGVRGTDLSIVTGTVTLGTDAHVVLSPSMVSDFAGYGFTLALAADASDRYVYTIARDDNPVHITKRANGTVVYAMYPDAMSEQSAMFTLPEEPATIPADFAASVAIVNNHASDSLTVATVFAGGTVPVTVSSGSSPVVLSGDSTFGGTVTLNGATEISGDATIAGAVSGSATLTVSGDITVASTGSIANTIAGDGTLTFAALPASALSFGNWTGTVVLPADQSFDGTFFDDYGVVGSTVRLQGTNTGWLHYGTVNATTDRGPIATTIEIPASASLTITGFSPSWANTFNVLKGAGTFAVSLSAEPDHSYPEVNAYFLLKDVSNFTGSLSATGAGIAIGASKPAYTTAGGRIMLTTSATIATGKTWTATEGVVLADAAATLTNADGALDPAPTTSVANSYIKSVADAGAITYSVEAYKTVTVVAGDSTVVISTNDVVVAGSSPYTLEAGTISLAVTPATGYKVTGVSASSGEVTGAGPYVYTVAGDVTITVATEAMGATVSGVSFSYGADYTNATVRATVTGDATSATLTYDGRTYTSEVGSGGAVTFEDVVVPARGNDVYAPVHYTITAKNGDTTVTTTGGSGEAPVADVTANWINENATTHGLATAGGSWTNAEAVSYSDGKAAISDNRFVATEASTASRVVLAFEVCFSSTSEDDVSGEAQAAIKLGEVNSATTFMVLTTGNTWMPVSRAGFTPDASATYNVVLTIDYGNNTYGVTVGNYVMTNSTGSASFSLAASKATVQNIDFVGSGTITSIKGDQVEGYMVVDKNGTRYVSIAAAISAYLNDPTIAPLTVLHDGTAPSGWKIVTEGGVDILKKIAKGLFFMAY